MSQEKYQPVTLDYQATLDKALQREGFKDAWDALEDEYAALKSEAAQARRGDFEAYLSAVPNVEVEVETDRKE